MIVVVPASSPRVLDPGRVVAWLQRHDPRWHATARAARTAVVMPVAFALGVRTGDVQTATFAGFGSFALLLLFDPPGTGSERLLSYLSLVGLGTVSILLATACAFSTATAVIGMAVFAFAVSMLASLGSYAAGSTTALLLTFILPVSIRVPWDEAPGRLAGWALAAVLAVPAALLLWPPRASDPVRAAAVDACRALGELFTAAGMLEGREPDAAASARAASDHLQTLFRSSPQRPGGAGEADRAFAVLVDELDWVAALADDLAAGDARGHPCRSEIRDELTVAGRLLVACAALLADPEHHAAEVTAAVAELDAARARAAEATLARLGTAAGGVPLASALDVSFLARGVGVSAQSVAEHVLRIREASGWQGLAGWRRWGRTAWDEARARLQPGSPVLRAAVRGAAALGASVLLTSELGVQRSFWVILGALSVLRATAVGTGSSAVRAVIGTAVGFVVGAVLLLALGSAPAALWALLPVAVFVAGIAPAMISFAAGQAAFTVTIVILFNILAPTGWQVGLLRIEDVALGCAVSVAVGLLFWPRGVIAGFGAALDEAYAAAADRLRRTVLLLTGEVAEAPDAVGRRLKSARRRLDDAFRLFLAERGTQRLPLRDATELAATATRLRLIGDSLDDLADGGMALGRPDGLPETRLRGAAAELDLWLRELGDAVAGRRADVPRPQGPDPESAEMLVAEARDGGRDGSHVARDRALTVVWTAQHLDAARRREKQLASAADALVRARTPRAPRLAR